MSLRYNKSQVQMSLRYNKSQVQMSLRYNKSQVQCHCDLAGSFRPSAVFHNLQSGCNRAEKVAGTYYQKWRTTTWQG